MEIAHFFNLSLLSFFILLALKFTINKLSSPRKLPPSPPARPIIGHLHLLRQPVHRSLHELSLKYGEILFLRYGSRKVLLVSSISAAEECFTKHDLVFANRPQSLAGKHLNYNSTTMGFSSYGDHWRNLRRLTTVELFSTSRLGMLSGIRTEEVWLLLKQLFGDCLINGTTRVDMTSQLTELVFNIVMRTIAGKRYYGMEANNEEAREFQNIIRDMESLRGSSNLSDYFAVLRWVDYGGVEERMKALMKKMDRFLQDLVEEHRRKKSVSPSTKQEKCLTLIDVMLSLKETEPGFYTDETIKGVIQTTLTAGTQTSVATMEWAMSLLLNNPEALQKAFDEIKVVIGQNRLLDEQDLPKLNFLQNIINETFRLFPPAPLLLPHESSEDSTVSGFFVPKGTMLLVNTWSMNRDPKQWEAPEHFFPERFHDAEGTGYKLLPFGAGRRACPGAGLAKRVIGLTLGLLIQCFEWERVSKVKIDMTEGTGLTMPRARRLEAVCRLRNDMIKVLSTL
ncbi:hypothetical protein K2173_012949 [Erythroxylum novogranatense]|uniref:Cytochrome P450 n=1 Tax=Erythroxylum novogranatense TaxID=1862640 RepID=A0AAV8S7G1_9ROSI|nr:hypothetical protein K2173_012949 [Erythroxylum novogranatense]